MLQQQQQCFITSTLRYICMPTLLVPCCLWAGLCSPLKQWALHTHTKVFVCVCVCELTLLDIMMVSRDLLCELKATLRVEAWTMMRMEWRTEEEMLRKTASSLNSTLLKLTSRHLTNRLPLIKAVYLILSLWEAVFLFRYSPTESSACLVTEVAH